MSAPGAPSRNDPFEGTAYRLLEPLDAGGMGEVFLVEHRQLARPFVAKVLHAHLAAHPQVVDRLRLEAQTLGRINHPNIVSISGFGTTSDGRPFLVMEYLRGRTLRAELVKRGTLPVDEAIFCVSELLAGLSAAHALGIVHRDIKPDNIFLAELPTGGRVLKILDFGIARVLPDASRAAPLPLALPTESGAVIGTPRFLSPEAAQGQRVDARADLYAAALVLYICLAGRGPFDHLDSAQDVLSAHANETPSAPSHHSPMTVPAELDHVVMRALAKNPEARFQTALEFRAELARLVAGHGPPAGFVETTSLGLEPQRTPSQPSPPAAAARPATAPSMTEDLRAESDAQWLAPPPRFSTPALVLIFVIGVLASAFATVALVGALTGN
jgi:eukaryotic-like serine/threonine-protein kinase